MIDAAHGARSSHGRLRNIATAIAALTRSRSPPMPSRSAPGRPGGSARGRTIESFKCRPAAASVALYYSASIMNAPVTTRREDRLAMNLPFIFSGISLAYAPVGLIETPATLPILSTST